MCTSILVYMLLLSLLLWCLYFCLDVVRYISRDSRPLFAVTTGFSKRSEGSRSIDFCGSWMRLSVWQYTAWNGKRHGTICLLACYVSHESLPARRKFTERNTPLYTEEPLYVTTFKTMTRHVWRLRRNRITLPGIVKS